MTTLTARITSKGQITVPKEVRDRLGVKPGDALQFSLDEGAEHAEVRPVRRRSIAEFRGIFRTERGSTASPDWAAQRDQAWRHATRRLAGSDEQQSTSKRQVKGTRG